MFMDSACIYVSSWHNPLEMESQPPVGHHVGAGNQSQVSVFVNTFQPKHHIALTTAALSYDGALLPTSVESHNFQIVLYFHKKFSYFMKFCCLCKYILESCLNLQRLFPEINRFYFCFLLISI